MCTQNGGTFFMNDDEFFYIVNFLSLNKKSNIGLFFYKNFLLKKNGQIYYFEEKKDSCW